MDARQRVSDLRQRLAGESVSAFTATQASNVVYLTGLEGIFDEERPHIALVTPDECVLLTDSRYGEAATASAAGSEWRVQVVRDDLWAAVEALLGDLDRVAVEDTMPYRGHVAVEKRFGSRLVTSSGWVEELRVRKSAEELACIAAAQELTDRGFTHILGFVRSGVSEAEIALELEFYLRRMGSEGVAFEPIVASGPNSALPHATVSGRVLGDGDFVMLDFGARVGGYCADMTRTLVVGRASERHREVYANVLSANRAGLAAMRAGALGRDVDAAARAVIEAAGYGQYFGHGLGHGVGMEVHEAPGVGPRSTAELPASAVVTVEPGVYIPGFGGVRIEDLVVVEASGARVLTGSAKDLIEIQ